MPKALLSIPPLQLSNGNSSEAETGTASSMETTDRSTASQSVSSADQHDHKSRRFSYGQGKAKARKIPGKRNQKKCSFNVNSQQKTSAVVKSRIPRSLVSSPSSSSTSVTSFRAFNSFRTSNTTSEDGSVTTKEQTITTVLQRQNTRIIGAYRQRKSISQIDIKQFRRNAQMSQSSNRDCNALLQTKNSRQDQIEFCNKIYHYNEMGYAGGAQQYPRMAGMKVFAILMLNAWRKRRNDVRCLREKIVELKKDAIKSRSQFHVLYSLFHGEEKRNDELKCHLKRSLDDKNTIKSTCESLTTSIASVKADNALLEQQLQTKDKEFESLNILLSQTKTELFKSMTVQRELQANNSMCHRQVQTLENEKNDLINEMLELDIQTSKAQELMKAEIQEKTDELAVTQAKLRGMEDKVAELHDYKQNMREEVEKLEEEIIILQRTLEKSQERRIKTFCNNALKYPGFAMQMLHWFAFYLLPATPAPKPETFPFCFKLLQGSEYSKALETQRKSYKTI